jgi:UDP-N-acetylglucosamine acyltransferase
VASNSIHPSAFIGPDVVLGSGNTVAPFAFIDGDVVIGDGNWIGPHVCIGTPAQFSPGKFEFNGQPKTGIRIGDRNIIREFATVHQPSKFITEIEDDCYVMAYCHVSHDTRICKGAIVTNNAQLGGFSVIQRHAFIGLTVTTHQHTTVGAYSVLGMGAIVAKDVPPFAKVYGSPARLAGVNLVGMERHGFSKREIDAVSQALDSGQLPRGVSSAVDAAVDDFIARNEATKRPSLLDRST